ncbi:MAG: hypothetical protein BAJALOKI3v1_130028 [Promethearchaeota archaeon]|nr:MAG: hypothetical protein BAJALOKI3v1_130028 [Candidatus Lokiarchaeota archaeon]
MKSGKALGAVSILLAIISLGLGGYVIYDIYLSPSSLNDSSSIDHWYKESSTYSFDSTSFEYVDPMSFTLELNETSSIYIVFNGFVRFPIDDTYNIVYLRIKINEFYEGREMTLEAESIDFRQRYSFALQYFDPSLPPNTYIISIWARTTADTTTLGEMSLYIQTIS